MARWLEGPGIRRHMCLSKGFLEVTLMFIAVCMNVRKSYAQEALGFLSIDCGNTETNYTDSNGLEWVADDGTYIKTGNSSEQLFLNSSIDRALRSFRYFPQMRSKYCFELPSPNVSYLVRASFYMNESVLNVARPFEFILYVDATKWFTVKSGANSDKHLFIVQEGIFHPPKVFMYLCLLPVVGVPFISSLELRRLDENIYWYSGTWHQYLALSIRSNGGANSTAPDIRYPDDAYDRIWKTPDASQNNNLSIISRSEPPDKSTSEDANYVPTLVMQDAWLFRSDADYLKFSTYANGSQFSLSSCVYAFVNVYTEYLDMSASSSYYFFVNLDPTSLEFQQSDNVDYINFSRVAAVVPIPWFPPDSDTINISVSLVDSNNNDVYIADGPNINAVEIYCQHDQNFTYTNTDDDQVITYLKMGFSLDDWQGDPCVPVPHDWLSCTLSESPWTPTSYVSSIILSKLTIDGFGNMTSYPTRLNSLNEMSITKCGVDNPTFQLLLNCSSMGLSMLNLSYNALTSLPTAQENRLESLVVLDLSHNQLQGDISLLDKWVEINSQSLQQLNVSNNNLSGVFNSSLYFLGLPNLITAVFDQNLIQGTLDLSAWYDALQEVSNATSENQKQPNVTLQLFSFVNNNISDITPSAETLAASLQNLLKDNPLFVSKGILLGGNPYCKHPQTYIHLHLCRSTISEDNKDGRNNKEKILIISICSGFAALLLCCAILITLWRLWKQVYTLREIQRVLANQKVHPPFFQYNDLKLATKDFHNNYKLGIGAFGIVYRAVLADQTPLAVKKLFNSQSLQALDEFLNEVVLITGIKHINLIQLKGCCIKDKQRMLVYEYAENGNLAEALWGSKAHGGLNWKMRYNICVGIARGLSYLHEELQPSIIHRDIKPENILLDKDFKPKIGDFGLARHFLGETHQAQYTQISKVAGTRGYFAPEYAMHGQLSEKADVYSYGILVLEVVSGRKCIDLSLPTEERILIDWVRSLQKKKSLFDVLQLELRHNCIAAEVFRAINIGRLCTQHNPKRRPSMSQVVTMFMGSMDIEVFSNELEDDAFNFKNFFAIVDHDIEYPTLPVVEENSVILPLLDIGSQSTQVSTSRGTNSVGLIELSSFHGR